ncbi:MAG: glycosyltransferase [Phycisphaerales bacterium]|nr:glycosyltransferase [Phycisphaerales bacterium]
METLVAILCVVFFALLVAVPSLYGFHMYLLLYLAHRRRASVRAEQQACIAHYQQSVPDEQWPLVTTQIPLYNEINVARRIIEAAARMDYPHGRHEVQVLDDSTDGTRQVVDHVVAELQSHGYHVVVVRRPQRTDYKAGALAHGLLTARGEFVAVFDADFVPDRGFLRRMVPLLVSDPRACAVQGRWGHLNAQETWITSGLALSLDNLFAIEQGARGWNGLLMGFNGTGGMWRRAAIDDPAVGGWSGDTITEDLDLSYRAQLAGWRMIYCADEVSPAELPADADAVKSQQRRWAVGTIQTARKLLPAVWRSQLPLAAKVEGTLHLLQYGIYLPMLCVALLGRLLPLLPMMLFDEPWPIWLNSVGLVFLGAALGTRDCPHLCPSGPGWAHTRLCGDRQVAPAGAGADRQQCRGSRDWSRAARRGVCPHAEVRQPGAQPTARALPGPAEQAVDSRALGRHLLLCTVVRVRRLRRPRQHLPASVCHGAPADGLAVTATFHSWKTEADTCDGATPAGRTRHGVGFRRLPVDPRYRAVPAQSGEKNSPDGPLPCGHPGVSPLLVFSKWSPAYSPVIRAPKSVTSAPVKKSSSSRSKR